MPTAEEFEQRIQEFRLDRLGISCCTPDEAEVARARCSDAQKELRLIKKEIGLAIREKQKGHGKAGPTTGAIRRLFAGKRHVPPAPARPAAGEEADLTPYERLQGEIERMLRDLERAKIDR